MFIQFQDKKRGKDLKEADTGGQGDVSMDMVSSDKIKSELNEGQGRSRSSTAMDCSEYSSTIQSPPEHSSRTDKQPAISKRSKFIDKQPFQKLLDYLLKVYKIRIDSMFISVN